MARAWSVALIGMDGALVEVEVAVGGGLPRTVLVGLPDTALYEARDRCRAAVSSSGLPWPSHLVTINLSPATLPKAGSHYDLSIVAALLAASELVPGAPLDHIVLLGELGLDGRVRSVRGLLPALVTASDAGISTAVVPHSQLQEAQLVPGLTVWGVRHLADVIDVLHGRPVLLPPPMADAAPDQPSVGADHKDLADVLGQVEAKWALEVAAAGRHHLYFQGPPGVGKTLLAERLPGILPDLSLAEAMEVSAIHSLSGLSLHHGLITKPPFAAPHHTASLASVVGGGARIAMPGSLSRAHLGVLLLDEAPEFPARVLDALRVPLESGFIVIGRSAALTRYPARFQLVLAANPCPCGHAMTPGTQCRCTPIAIRRYQERISGPILDRIDIRQHLRPLKKSYLKAAARLSESTAVVAERVAQARQRQRARLEPWGFRVNSEVPGVILRRELAVPKGIDILDDAVAKGNISARGVDKCLRLAWTIADLDGQPKPDVDHVHAALAMRRGEQP